MAASCVVARSALSGQLLGSAESVEEVQQQITRQLGVSSALGSSWESPVLR